MKKMEIILIPSSSGVIKVYIYGFGNGYGKVYATLNEVVATSKGYNVKRTILKALSKLNQSLINKEQ